MTLTLPSRRGESALPPTMRDGPELMLTVSIPSPEPCRMIALGAFDGMLDPPDHDPNPLTGTRIVDETPNALPVPEGARLELVDRAAVVAGRDMAERLVVGRERVGIVLLEWTVDEGTEEEEEQDLEIEDESLGR